MIDCLCIPTVVPVITYPPDNFTFEVNEGMTVTFGCNATGIPAPTIVWFRNNTELNITTNSQVRLNDPTNPVVVSSPGGNILSVSRELMISDTVDQDSGTYSCVASNGVGSMRIEQEFELFVQSKNSHMHFEKKLQSHILTLLSTFLPTVEPEITDSPDNVTLVEGSGAVFTCVATARPRPSITWWVVQDGGSPTMITSDSTKYSIAEMLSGERVLHSMLEVFGTIPSDAGTYICIANNPTNIPAMAQAVLTVLGMYVI